MHNAARATGLFGYQGFGRFGLGQHGVAVAQKGFARFGDGKAPRGAVQQAHAQAFFQQRHPAAEFGFGHAQRTAGGGKAAVIGYGGKVGEVVQILHGAEGDVGSCACCFSADGQGHGMRPGLTHCS